MDPKDNLVPRTDAPSGRPLLWGAAVLVLLAGGLLALLWPTSGPLERGVALAPSSEKVPAAAPRRAERPREIAPVRAPLPEPSPPPSPPSAAARATTDLFAGNVPELLGMGRKVVQRKGRLNPARLKEIYQYAKENPTDARPHLLMGADSRNRGWNEFAIGHYERAFKADPVARDDAAMLTDLVEIAAMDHHGDKAAAALQSIYGVDAVPAVLAAADRMTAEGHPTKAERLVRLSTSLAEATGVN